jgi:RNA polymerase sigma-70 factor (ECF subfamily)
MGLLPEAALPDSFAPYEACRQQFGFVPALFSAQSLLPRLIEAETQIVGAILQTPGALTRVQKKAIVQTVASRCRTPYCDTFARHAIKEAGVLTRDDRPLLDAVEKLGSPAGRFSKDDVDSLHRAGCSDQHIFEATLTTALTRFLCALSAALKVEPDVAAEPGGPVATAAHTPLAAGAASTTGEAFGLFQEAFGFVPRLFRAQALRPDVLDAEAVLLGQLLLPADALSRVQKEQILLAISAANLNTYCVTLHGEVLRLLGVDEATSEQIVIDHRNAEISPSDRALLDLALSVARGAALGPEDLKLLHEHGLSDRHILEAVAVSSLAIFVNTLEGGFGTSPDFPPRHTFTAVAIPDPGDEHRGDPDMQLVERAREGYTDAFEELVRRHHRRILRAAWCVTGNHADAEDAAQVAFLKAFQALGTFERHARFTTWLTRIAINEALSRVRARPPMDSLSFQPDDPEDFRPTDVTAWVDNPERLYQRGELRAMIERAMSDMPVKYRMAVLLRDIDQLSTNDAAMALGIPVPTLKKHLLKGRLMLREALAPHFIPRRGAEAGV